MKRIITDGEEGHAAPLIGTMVGGVGAVVLAIGAANDADVATIIGGIVLAVGLSATVVLNHMTVDYGIFGRLDQMEK